jgi:hypothetical protein
MAYTINVEWNEEKRVWVASFEGGLASEADTLAARRKTLLRRIEP